MLETLLNIFIVKIKYNIYYIKRFQILYIVEL
jgi:hypothetical protein